MKKLILSILFSLSSIVAAEEWKTAVQIDKTVVELKIETSSVKKHKTLDMWSSTVFLQKDEQSIKLFSAVSGCQNFGGQIVVMDEQGKKLTGENPIKWMAKEKDIESLIASFTCAAAYKHGLLKMKEVI